MKRPASTLWRAIALGGALFAVTMAKAQSLPRPAEFYFGEDVAATRPIIAVPGADPVDRLLRLTRANPRAHEANLQLAAILMAAGRVDAGKLLYDRTLAALSPGQALYSSLLWNYGWDLYRAGDAEGALQKWTQLVNSRNHRAGWMPQTLALALWRLGRKDEAMSWYAAAVRTNPGVWTSPGDIAAVLPDWREDERATLLEVQRAWAANPPAWP